MTNEIKVLRSYDVYVDPDVLDDITERDAEPTDLLIAATQQCDIGNLQGNLFFVRYDVVDVPEGGSTPSVGWLTLEEMNIRRNAKVLLGPVAFRVQLDKWYE